MKSENGILKKPALVSFKLILSHITLPFDKAVWALRRRSAKYERLRIQECQFQGRKDFLSMSGKAMETLHGLDRQLCESLAKASYVFWDEPAGNIWFKWHCGIGPEYLFWKEQGIIVCVVYTY